MYKVLHVGPSRNLKGGISSVIETYHSEKQFFEKRGIELSFFGTPLFQNKKNFLVFLTMLPHFISLARAHDLLHFHVASNGSFIRKFVLFLIGKMLGKKILFHLHGGAFFEYMDNSGCLVKKLIVFFTKNSDGIAVVSTEFKREFEGRLKAGEGVYIIPNSSPEFENINLVGEQSGGGNRYVLFCGRLSHDKGLEDLIIAVSILKESKASIDLVVAGNGPIKYWQEMSRKYNVEDRVHFAGWVSGDEKIKLYLASTIFCLPSHVESFGISALEAMFSRKPLVCTRLGGFLDLVTHMENGLLVSPNSPSEIAECIRMLASNKELAAEMGQSGFNKAVTLFTKKVAMERTMSIYNSILMRDSPEKSIQQF